MLSEENSSELRKTPSLSTVGIYQEINGYVKCVGD